MGKDQNDMDFAASLDHNQIDHFSHEDWKTSKFVYGSEAEATIKGVGKLHFDMIFKSKNDFQNFINKPEYKDYFGYTTLRGNNWKTFEGFTYDKMEFTKNEFANFIEGIIKAGGVFNIPHPLQNNPIYSETLEDFYFKVMDEINGSQKQLIYGFQVITGGLAARLSTGENKVNHEAWTNLLAKGYRIYATSGSDTHKGMSDEALTSIYAKTCKADGTKCRGEEDACQNPTCAGNDKGNLLEQIKNGDYSAGAVGIQMCMYGDNKSTVMGGSCNFSENKRLVIGIGDIHYSYKDGDTSFNVLPDHKFRVHVLNEKGVVYTQLIQPGEKTVIALDVENCGLYRVEVYDENHKSTPGLEGKGLLIGLSNPIWNDGYDWNNN